MPRPATLPLIDWKAVFASGKDYQAWIKAGEFPDKCQAMEEALRAQQLDPQQQAWLGALPRPVHVVAIAEDWCGDVVRHVPVLQKLAEAAPNLKVRYITRQQWPDVFARFLTNGGEAIPKFVFLSEDFVECGNWGPMAASCRELIARGKACNNVAAARQKVHALYDADPGKRVVVAELMQLADVAASREP
jgi:thiol-disulfide isomerase/thioredoxin